MDPKITAMRDRNMSDAARLKDWLKSVVAGGPIDDENAVRTACVCLLFEVEVRELELLES